MLSLAVDLAIFKRLTGWPLDSSGRPVVDPTTLVPVNRTLVGPPRLEGVLQPSYGVRLPVPKMDISQYDLKTTSPETVKPYADGFHPDMFTQVPVFWESTNGRDWESVFPSVIFGETGTVAPDVYVYYDDIERPDPAAGTLTLPDGTIVPAGYIISPHPEQTIFTYCIKAFAMTRVEMSLLSTQIERLFPQKTALIVERADGSTLAFDMIRYSIDDLSVRSGDKEKAFVGDLRFYGKAYNYRVEAYGDFESSGFGDQFSQQREATLLSYIMELVDSQNRLLVQHTETETAVPTP